MVTDSDIINTASSHTPHTYYGLSTDDKPATANNGSMFVEMDTSKLYLYDADGAAWREFGGAG